jgi:hypothetical protein
VAEEEVCGRERFSVVEDRPVLKERVERVLEHRPMAKDYVTETKFVGGCTWACVVSTRRGDGVQGRAWVCELGGECWLAVSAEGLWRMAGAVA